MQPNKSRMFTPLRQALQVHVGLESGLRFVNFHVETTNSNIECFGLCRCDVKTKALALWHGPSEFNEVIAKLEKKISEVENPT